MHLDGGIVIDVERERLWNALHDIQILKHCIRGCQELEWIDSTSLHASIGLKIAGRKKTYSGTVRIADAIPPSNYTLLLGEQADRYSVRAEMQLNPIQKTDCTQLIYIIDASLDGYLGRLGDSVATLLARKLSEDFFRRLSQELLEEVKAASNA